MLVPFKTAYLDLRVAQDINELVEKVRRRLNPNIRILGYFGTIPTFAPGNPGCRLKT